MQDLKFTIVLIKHFPSTSVKSDCMDGDCNCKVIMYGTKQGQNCFPPTHQLIIRHLISHRSSLNPSVLSFQHRFLGGFRPDSCW